MNTQSFALRDIGSSIVVAASRHSKRPARGRIAREEMRAPWTANGIDAWWKIPSSDGREQLFAFRTPVGQLLVGDQDGLASRVRKMDRLEAVVAAVRLARGQVVESVEKLVVLVAPFMPRSHAPKNDCPILRLTDLIRFDDDSTPGEV
jgi:hypothetical protein